MNIQEVLRTFRKFYETVDTSMKGGAMNPKFIICTTKETIFHMALQNHFKTHIFPRIHTQITMKLA